MSLFDDREKAFEKKIAHDQELAFKVTARRNKLLGLWAAEKMGMETSEAAEYAKQVVLSEYEEAGDDDVFRKVQGDFAAKGVTVNDNELRAKMNALMDEARRQFMEG